MKNAKNQKKAFTLIEMVVSLTVFTVIVTIGANVYVTAARGQKRANLEASIYNESRAIIDKLSREIRHKTIDYDEYYNQKIIKADAAPDAKIAYGANFGEYGKNFYDPGWHYGSPAQPDRYAQNEGFGKREGLGAQCNNAVGNNTADNTGAVQPPPCPANSVILKKTLDTDTGRNGWNDDVIANAFCDNYSTNKVCPAAFKELYANKELYLIDASAGEKTILTLEGGRLTLLKLIGRDDDNDGINEIWCCHPDFNCGETVPDQNCKTPVPSQEKRYGFVPITPATIEITNLNFIVSPLEDPRRAFNENTDAVQVQPHVIIEMTLSPSKEVILNYPDKKPEITVRTAVSSRANAAIKSYDPS